jgi:hypothetical protein
MGNQLLLSSPVSGLIYAFDSSAFTEIILKLNTKITKMP